jgi:hypothetical protein
MTQAYILPATAPTGRTRAAKHPSGGDRALWSRLVRSPLAAVHLAWRVTFRLVKLLVLLPLAVCLAFLVWFAVRLIRG